MEAVGFEVQSNARPPRCLLDDLGEPLEGFTYDDCAPFTGDDVAWRPVWRDGRTPGAVGRRFIRIGVRLLNARLYAIRGDFYASAGLDMGLFNERGITPRPNSAFWR